MSWLLGAVLVLILLFGGVLLFGAPYLPTLRRQTETALDLLELESGDTLLELGCGDGRVLRLAAGRGIRGVGFEINPLLVVVARLNTWRYRHSVRIVWGNFWIEPWPDDSRGIFVFLHPRFMTRLDARVKEAYPRGIRLASFAFKITSRKADTVKNGVYLYRY